MTSIHLTNGRLAAEILTLGATLRSLTFEGTEVLLRLEDEAGYATNDFYLNPVIGRCANRIAQGRFEIDGEDFQVSANEGPNTLHGGTEGWNRADWRVVEASEDRVRLSHRSPDGDMGFPGAVDAEVDLALNEDSLEIVWSARADRPTPVNMTHHLYFNLSGEASSPILDHSLQIGADAITPCGPGLIPTGEIASVEGSPFDFRRARRIGEALSHPDPRLEAAGGLDINFVLSGAPPALILHSPESGITLTVETDQPGMQIYSGRGLRAPFVKHAALAIEPQGFPDAPNHPTFPSVILRPGETYRRRALYRFHRARV